MLSAQDNEALTRVGPGTPMGELLRRYWHPVAPVSEVREKRIVPVRILGEDLVLFTAGPDRLGLISRRCAHRNVDLSVCSWIDDGSLRCAYHGWAYDAEGRCAQQPFDGASGDDRFREKIRVDAYPTRSIGGLAWAYLGSGEPPSLPDFEPYGWRRGFTEISVTVLPCNWFQCHENGVDPVHFEWLHTNWSSVQRGPHDRSYGPAHLAVDFDEFEFGFICGRELAPGNTNMRPLSRSNSVSEGGILCVWPYTLVTGQTIEWRVPVDDEHTLNITRQYSVLPDDQPPVSLDPGSIPYWYGPLTDPVNGRVITSHTLNQDFAAWVAQGAVARRDREHLGRSDAGIIRLRRRYLQEMDRVARGADPPGVVRGPGDSVQVELPIYMKSWFANGVSPEKFRQLHARIKGTSQASDGYFSVQAGRPEHVRRLFAAAAGVPAEAAH
jgi:5,5'-dehydrodivanillate O-demethylase oxygenase subunit